jgi:peptidoglycan hydrolase-like protein with peptidoglycan-binding domain
MPGIFINYRRDDAAGFARSLYEHLDQEFRAGQVFMDVEALREPGIDFAREIERSLGRCAVMLVLVGKTWLSATGPGGARRIDEPDDFVRLEIATALKRDVRVIPVLLNGAVMPSTDALPPDLQALGRRQAIAIAHDDWTHDVTKLVEALAKIPGIRKRSARGRTGWSTRSLVVAATVGAVLGLGLLVWAGFKIEDLVQQGAAPPATTYVPATDAAAPATDYAATPVTTEAGPIASPPAAASASRDEVYRAQRLLGDLGYDPGMPDGVSGAATAAAVRAFQADEGYAVTGEIDGALLAELEEILAYRSSQATTQDAGQPAYASAPAPVEQPAAEPAAWGGYRAANVSGTWYDNNGLAAQIVQDGGNLTVGALNPSTGYFQVIGYGSVDGDIVSIQYQNFAGIPGIVQAQVAPDGTHMSGTDTSSLLNIPVPNTWHREHLPGGD